MQDEKYIRARITELRIKKNVSEYRMSLDLGHSDRYKSHYLRQSIAVDVGIFIYVRLSRGNAERIFR